MKTVLAVAALFLGTCLASPQLTVVDPDVAGTAWGELKSDDEYTDAGIIEQVGDLPVYRIGTGNEKCVIWNPDIWGFDSGITRQLADRLSAELGITVIVPDYFRGDYRSPQQTGFREFLGEVTNWDNLRADWEDKLKPYAEEKHGCKTYGTHGTCWGTYLVVRLSALPEFVAGTQAHPSHPGIMTNLGEDEEEAYKAIRDTPQLFLPAGSDPDSVKPRGLACKTLGGEGNGHRSIVFPNMRHGWTVRGDLSDPTVATEMRRAYDLVKEHFNKNL